MSTSSAIALQYAREAAQRAALRAKRLTSQRDARAAFEAAVTELRTAMGGAQ